MTHTYVVLEVSRSAYDEIRNLLQGAGYWHCFPRGGDGEIDMHGIALLPIRADLEEIEGSPV